MIDCSTNTSVFDVVNTASLVLKKCGLEFVNFGFNISENPDTETDSISNFDWNSNSWVNVGLKFKKESKMYVVIVFHEPEKGSISFLHNHNDTCIALPVKLQNFETNTFLTTFEKEFVDKMLNKNDKKSVSSQTNVPTSSVTSPALPYLHSYNNEEFGPFIGSGGGGIGGGGGMIFSPPSRRDFQPPFIDPLMPRPPYGARYDPTLPPVGSNDLYGDIQDPTIGHRVGPTGRGNEFRNLPQFNPGGGLNPPGFNQFM